MAQYKTIVLEMIQEQYPALQAALRARRMLLPTVNLQATALKRYHETWIDRLGLKWPERDPIQIASEAMELAIEDLRDDLRCESPPSGTPAEPLSLDAAIASIRRPLPPA